MDRPTFGDWRRRQTAGWGNFGLAASLALLGSLVVGIILISFAGFWTGIISALVILVLLLPLGFQNRFGFNVYQRLLDRLRWRVQRSKGTDMYVSGPLSRTPSVHPMLPGLAAKTTAFTAKDARGRGFVVLDHPHHKHVTTVLECQPPGTAMVDPATADEWVAQYGRWLTELGNDDGLVGAQVVVETRPDPGVELRRNVDARIVADAPELAASTIRELVDGVPRGSSQTRVFAALTWSRSRGAAKARSVEDMAIEIGQRLPALCGILSEAGGGAVTPMTSGDLAGVVLGAFSPSLYGAIETRSDELK